MTVAEICQIHIGISAVVVAFLGIILAGLSLYFFVQLNNKLIKATEQSGKIVEMLANEQNRREERDFFLELNDVEFNFTKLNVLLAKIIINPEYRQIDDFINAIANIPVINRIIGIPKTIDLDDIKLIERPRRELSYIQENIKNLFPIEEGEKRAINDTGDTRKVFEAPLVSLMDSIGIASKIIEKIQKDIQKSYKSRIPEK